MTEHIVPESTFQSITFCLETSEVKGPSHYLTQCLLIFNSNILHGSTNLPNLRSHLGCQPDKLPVSLVAPTKHAGVHLLLNQHMYCINIVVKIACYLEMYFVLFGNKTTTTTTTITTTKRDLPSNGNIFRVIGLLCGDFSGHRWIPLTKASDGEIWCFLSSAPE